MLDLPGGKKGIASSDGMGSDEEGFPGKHDGRDAGGTARKQGFSKDGPSDDEYGSGDRQRRSAFFHDRLSLFDLYSGTCREFVGRPVHPTTFIKREGRG